MENSFGARLLQTFGTTGQLCVGLDPSAEQLAKWDFPISASGAEQFCKQVLDSCYGEVGILKPQVAFFEQYGSEGYAVLEKFLIQAAELGFIVVADSKRGDIGSTMDGYARAWLANEGPFLVDAVTVSPYLGAESFEETIGFASSNAKGIFILAATSNPEAKSLQLSIGSNRKSVARNIASYAASKNKSPLGSVGLVIGAQTNLGDMSIDSMELVHTPILAPGFGAQGGNLADARSTFGELADVTIFNVSRSVAGDSPTGLRERVQRANSDLEIGLSR